MNIFTIGTGGTRKWPAGSFFWGRVAGWIWFALTLNGIGGNARIQTSIQRDWK